MFRATKGLNTLFNKNGSVRNTLITDLDYKNRALVDMYKKLSDYVNAIRKLLDLFASGHFFEVASVLTESVYNSMCIDLNSMAVDPIQYPEFENLRLAQVKTLQGLYQGVKQYADLVNTQIALSSANECCDTLRDPVKLKEYIDMMRNNSRVFPDSSVTVKKATLKPQYAEYIKLFGYPEGGNFDPDKMAQVIKMMEIQTKPIFRPPPTPQPRPPNV